MSSALTINPIKSDKESSNDIPSFPDFSKNIPNQQSENESSYCDEIEIPIIDKIIYCPCCKSSVKMKFISHDEIYIKCEKKKQTKKVKEILEEYIFENNIDMKKEEEVQNLYCRRHVNLGIFNKYEKYCINCKYDLCQDCIVKTKMRCGGHDSKYLNLDESKKKFLLNYLQNNENNKGENMKNFCIIIKVLLFTNKEFPNLRSLISLENLYKYLKKGISYKKIKETIIIKKTKDFKINKESLKENSKKKFLEIYIEEQNFRSIKFLAKKLKNINNDISLVKLSLLENNLTSVKPLTKIVSKFVNLTHLDLSRNNLGNKNIDYIGNFQCKNLKYLYLHRNDFTDYNLINIVNEKFGSNLKVFFIGFNRFSGKTKPTKIYDFKNLKSIGLNYVFNKENYSIFLTNFKMENLELLYIQNNGIDSMAFLQKMNLPELREVYLANNEAEILNMEDFVKFPNLERIFVDYSTLKIINLKSVKQLEHFQYIDISKKDNIKLNYNIICDIIANKNTDISEDTILEL